ncbi:hypothetical protein GWE18_06065 [Bradyrhizobium sp. CSA112]|nr:hypothetical protein [Bradyrhizobium sp. CSA112]
MGWNGRWSDNLGTNNLDVRFKSNPGGVLSGNNSQAWSAFTNGRVTDAQTNLVTAEFGRVTPLPKGLSLKSEVSMLASSKPLPDTERIALGGMSAVRALAGVGELLKVLASRDVEGDQKEQGRRRSIPSTTLPAPDIEIGSRHPVNYRMPGILTGICEPVHKGGKKLRQRLPQRWKISRRKAALMSRPLVVSQDTCNRGPCEAARRAEY